MANDLKLKVVINAEGNAEGKISSLSSGLGRLGGIAGGVATAGLAAAGAGIVALGAGLFTSVDAAMEAQAGQAELAAVLESTGGKAGVTADAVNALASEFQNLTPFEDDAILAGQNMLLTFTNIGKDVFPAATEAMLNMGQKFGSIDAAAVQLGKALNDPIAGVSALQRVGVALTDAQEEQITSFMAVGDIASAQKIILAELETEFGGLAVAAGETFPGKLAILKNTFGDIQETIGAAFLPALSLLADQFSAGLRSPESQAMLEGLTTFIVDTGVPALLSLGRFVGDAAKIFSQWTTELSANTGPIILMVNDALTRIAAAFGMTSGEVSAGDVILVMFKGALDALVIGLQLGALALQGLAASIETARRIFDIAGEVITVGVNAWTTGFEGAARAIQWVVDKFNSMREAARRAVDSIPAWLRPGSPTPFEVGLRGIAGAAEGVGQALPAAFNVGGASAAMPGLAGGGARMAAAATAGGGGVVVNLTYAPTVSTADQIELKRLLTGVVEEINRGRR